MFLRGRWIVGSELIASLHSRLMKDAITAPSEACTKGEQQRMMEESVTLRYDVVAMRKLHYMVCVRIEALLSKRLQRALVTL